MMGHGLFATLRVAYVLVTRIESAQLHFCPMCVKELQLDRCGRHTKPLKEEQQNIQNVLLVEVSLAPLHRLKADIEKSFRI